jgi:hypothetical protein
MMARAYTNFKVTYAGGFKVMADSSIASFLDEQGWPRLPVRSEVRALTGMIETMDLIESMDALLVEKQKAATSEFRGEAELSKIYSFYFGGTSIPADTPQRAVTTDDKKKPVEEWVQTGSGYKVIKIDAMDCYNAISPPHNVLQVHDVSVEMPTSIGARASFECIPLQHLKVTRAVAIVYILAHLTPTMFACRALRRVTTVGRSSPLATPPSQAALSCASSL